MKTYIASDAEAKALADGTQILIVVPCDLPRDLSEEYPGACWRLAKKPQYATENEWCFVDIAHPIESYPWLIEAPFAPGDIVQVKEAVATDGPWNIPSECHYWYPADGGEQPKGFQLRSAYHAPVEAIRTRLPVERVECRQVQSIALPEIYAFMGWTKTDGTCVQDFGLDERLLRERWDRNHPDLPWSANPWSWFTFVRKVQEDVAAITDWQRRQVAAPQRHGEHREKTE